MNYALRTGLLAFASTLACLGTAQAEVGSLWELFQGNDRQAASTQSQWNNTQAGYAGNQQVAYASQTGIAPTSFCSDCGCYDCCCDPGCCCDTGCCCESSCCCEPSCDCGSCADCCDCCSSCGGSGGVYAQVDILFLRAHVPEGQFGKLSEEYEFSPRATFGYENCHGQGGRARLWHYGHHLDNILTAGGGARFEWNVLDAELTKRFIYGRTDAIIGGGARLTNAEITSGGVSDDIDMIGLTLAADFETLCFCKGNSYVSSIYGGRFSLLGGDWERDGATLQRDDNINAYELYAGVEYGCCMDSFSLFTQLKFEMQNWHSDHLASAPGVNGYSVGFVGPSFAFGVGF